MRPLAEKGSPSNLLRFRKLTFTVTSQSPPPFSPCNCSRASQSQTIKLSKTDLSRMMFPRSNTNLQGTESCDMNSKDDAHAGTNEEEEVKCSPRPFAGGENQPEEAVSTDDPPSNYDMILQQEEMRVAQQLQILQQAREDFQRTRQRASPANQMAMQMMMSEPRGSPVGSFSAFNAGPARFAEDFSTLAAPTRPLPTPSHSSIGNTNPFRPTLPPLGQPAMLEEQQPQEGAASSCHQQPAQGVAKRANSVNSGKFASNTESQGGLSKNQSSHPKSSSRSFASKLFDMLSNEKEQEFSQYITWMPHGRAFKVLVADDPGEFEDRVLKKYFRTNKLSSFMRQINGWGFKRISIQEHRDFGAYFHPLFIRGRMDLVQQMKRAGRGEEPLAWMRHKCSDTGRYLFVDQNPDFYKLMEQEEKPATSSSRHKTTGDSWQEEPRQPHHSMPNKAGAIPSATMGELAFEPVSFQESAPPAPSQEQSLVSAMSTHHENTKRQADSPQSLEAEYERPGMMANVLAQQGSFVDDLDPRDIVVNANEGDDEEGDTVLSVDSSIFDEVDDEWSRRSEEEAEQPPGA